MKRITITIDEPTEYRLKKLMAAWNTTKSETIRICVDEVFINKFYNGYGILCVHPEKKGDEKKRNV